jgi:Zn-dependent protease with chaperone function
VTRRPGRTTLALVVPLALFIVFGMARVVAPVGLLGVVFDDPRDFAIAAAATSLLGAVLLAIRPFELRVAGVIAGPSEPPTPEERARLEPLLARVGEKAGIDPSRLILRVQDSPGVNAAAGGGHLLFVTRGAFGLPDESLEAILAHELGHHRGLHPVMTAVVWWLRLPGAAIAAVYRVLRRAVAAVTSRLGALGRLIAIPLLLALVVWQVTVMWLFYVADLFAQRAARISEYEADATAARWGYAEPLAAAYRSMPEVEDERRWKRLMDDHPPLHERIERLTAAA